MFVTIVDCCTLIIILFIIEYLINLHNYALRIITACSDIIHVLYIAILHFHWALSFYTCSVMYMYVYVYVHVINYNCTSFLQVGMQMSKASLCDVMHFCL